jgi:NAD-dependent deacetylase
MTLSLIESLRDLPLEDQQITVLTGAGISAESGIPTFRGPEGYWTIGASEYHPQEMATLRMFEQHPEEVWPWYLYRLFVCISATPNPGHLALVDMEHLFQNRFMLITQNVDGLHLSAGNSLERTYQIHGNLQYMRCARACGQPLLPIPRHLARKDKKGGLSPDEMALLQCPACGYRTRPHVLWFDETYDEEYFHFYSALEVARRTTLLIVVGTSGATNLPNQIVVEVFRAGGMIVDINIEPTHFSRIAQESQGGGYIEAPSGEVLPEIFKAFSKP